MKVIDRLREMPEKRRAATPGPWFIINMGLRCDSGLVPSDPENRIYAAACGNYSEDDWAAIVELVEAAAERRQADITMDVFLEDDGSREDEIAAYAAIYQARERLDAALAKLGVES